MHGILQLNAKGERARRVQLFHTESLLQNGVCVCVCMN